MDEPFPHLKILNLVIGTSGVRVSGWELTHSKWYGTESYPKCMSKA